MSETSEEVFVETWRADFTGRELKEIDFCLTYATQFAHGASNHNLMMLVARMAVSLDQLQALVSEQNQVLEGVARGQLGVKPKMEAQSG